MQLIASAAVNRALPRTLRRIVEYIRAGERTAARTHRIGDTLACRTTRASCLATELLATNGHHKSALAIQKIGDLPHRHAARLRQLISRIQPRIHHGDGRHRWCQWCHRERAASGVSRVVSVGPTIRANRHHNASGCKRCCTQCRHKIDDVQEDFSQAGHMPVGRKLGAEGWRVTGGVRE